MRKAFLHSFFILLAVLFFRNNANAQQEPLENIKITINFAADPGASLSVKKTPLRYNKDFAVILQMDNSSSDLFTKVYDYFRGFNGNPGLFYTSGVINNSIHFRMGTGLYSFDQTGKDVHDNDPDKLTWSDIQTLWAASFDVASQGLTHPPTDHDFYEVNRNISYSKKRFNEYFNQPTFNPDIYVVPDDKLSQIQYAKSAGNLAIYSTSPYAVPDPFNVDDIGSFYNLEVKRTHISSNLFNDISNLAAQSQNGKHMVGTFYCSGFDKTGEISFTEFKNQMNQVAATYGKGGLDNIWVGSAKEVFEYLDLYKKIKINKAMNGNTLEITLSADQLPETYRYYALTILVNSDQIITGMNVTGAIQSNYKYENNRALINLHWNGDNPPSIYQTVQDAIAQTEANPDSAHCLISSDYVQMITDQDSLLKYQDLLCGICTSVDLDFCPYKFNIPDDTICKGDTVVLTAPDDMQSYLWSVDSTTQSITVWPESTTDYWVKVVTQDGEEAVDTVRITVYDPPEIVDAQKDTVIMVPGSKDTLWVKVNDQVSYLWNTGSTDSAIIVDAPENGESLYSVLITKDYDGHGCSVEKDFLVTTYFESDIDFLCDTVCFGDTTTLVAKVITNDSIVEIKWDLTESGEFGDATGDTVKYSFQKEGNILVGMRVIYFSGNMDVVYNAVPVADRPVANFYYENACFGNTTMFYDSSLVDIGEVVSWYWNFGDGDETGGKNQNHYYQEKGTYNVKLVVASSYGCVDSISKLVKIDKISDPILKTADGQVINYNDSVLLADGGHITVTVQNPADYDSVIWNGYYKGNSLDIFNTGSYTVTGYSSGCTGVKTFFVVNSLTPGPGPAPGNPTEKAMNLFTPNGDGFNDYWKVNVIGMTYPVSVTIYNRYGNEVYHSDNYQNDWNGYRKGNPLPQATYYYIIKDATGKIFKGPVTIIR
jgi:gliding motility-associated-like protein